MPNLLTVACESAAIIGDIHGNSELLQLLLETLPEVERVIVVGDVCDRGPDTRGVIDLLIEHGAIGALGNHDEWLCRWALGEGFDSFALNSIMQGDATLASYGVVGRSPSDVERQRWRVPVTHRRWLAELGHGIDLRVRGEQFWVIHAGLDAADGGADPDLVRDLARRRPSDLLWRMNDPESQHGSAGTVVMGHQPRRMPLDAGHTIAIDTSAAGTLTAVILPERRFVTVGTPTTA